MFKKQNKKGSYSLTLVLAMPIILMFIFFLFDFLHLSAQKVRLQRNLDSATLTAAILSQPDDDVLVDSDGIIVEEQPDGSVSITGKKACAITPESYDIAMKQLAKTNGGDVVIAEYDAVGNITNQAELNEAQLAIYNISTPEQMENGVVRIQGIAKMPMMATIFTGKWLSWKYISESYAVCNAEIIEIDIPEGENGSSEIPLNP